MQLKSSREGQNRIPYILHPTKGDKLYHPKCIANAFQAYYSAPYNLKDDPSVTQPTKMGISGFLETLNLPKLSVDQLSIFKAPFTTEEILRATSTLPNGKTSGTDSFLAEYYKLFSNTLSPHMCQTFNTLASFQAKCFLLIL